MNTPAESLTNLCLPGGWTVGELLPSYVHPIGNHFYCAYDVANSDGRLGYLKVLDLARSASAGADVTSVYQEMLNAYNFERDVVLKCKERKLHHVVLAIDNGTYTHPEQPFVPIPFLVFERGDGDVRKFVTHSARFDVAWALRTLHHVAAAIQQLHGQDIAHQNLAPESVHIFKGYEAKVGDLSRAAAMGYAAPHDNHIVPGNHTYAPPELLYGFWDPEWRQRCFANDVYQLGSLLLFSFLGTAMTPLLRAGMDDAVIWSVANPHQHWRGTYAEVLPYVRVAFNKALSRFDESLSARNLQGQLRIELVSIARTLCEPDPALRGDPHARAKGRGQFSMEHYISRLNVLASEAQFVLRGGVRP